MQFGVDDMIRFAGQAWGEIGVNVVNKWAEFNESYFGGKLKPIPIIITPTLPYGKRLADSCSGLNGARRLIRLNLPVSGHVLIAEYNGLLHEMVHQFLFEHGEAAGHDSEGWRREIMRLNKMITGAEIWAGKYKTARKKDSPDRKSYVVRINEPHPDGRPSLPQKEIAGWPHDGCGIYLGRLGE